LIESWAISSRMRAGWMDGFGVRDYYNDPDGFGCANYTQQIFINGRRRPGAGAPASSRTGLGRS